MWNTNYHLRYEPFSTDKTGSITLWCFKERSSVNRVECSNKMLILNMHQNLKKHLIEDQETFNHLNDILREHWNKFVIEANWMYLTACCDIFVSSTDYITEIMAWNYWSSRFPQCMCDVIIIVFSFPMRVAQSNYPTQHSN